MTPYNEIKDVHLEIATLCNAVCPLCPRNVFGYSKNEGYPETYMTLAQAKKIFSIDFLQQLDRIIINGNYGDIVMNPEAISIIEYFRKNNSNIQIDVCTNGSARDRDFWRSLAKLKVKVIFSIDGLEDTNIIYRQNTRFDVIMKNVKEFITAGGIACWKMVIFKHNRHQIEEAKKLSKEMKFFAFTTQDEGRDSGPVFDKNGKFVRVIGDYTGPTSLKEIYNNDIPLDEKVDKVSCSALSGKRIYIGANGDVSPCCWTGFYPKTYRPHNNIICDINEQLSKKMNKYNAIDHPLHECIEWFDNFNSKWNNKQDRIKACDYFCGSKQANG